MRLVGYLRRNIQKRFGQSLT